MALGDTRGGDIGWRKWLLATWAVLECLLFSGVMFGWPSLVWVLKDKGVYADLCAESSSTNTSLPTTIQGGVTQSIAAISTITTGSAADDDTNKCEPQDARMTLCFTIATATIGIGAGVFGYINYKFSTRITRIICYWIYVIALLCMAFVTTGTLYVTVVYFTNIDTPWLMFPGLVLIGVGGLPVMMTSIQVAKLFQKGSSSLIGLLHGAFDTSSVVMLIIKLAYQSGFATKYTLITIAAVFTAMIAVSTFVFLPKGFIEDPDISEGDGAQVKKDYSKCISCLKNPMFITHVSWLCLLSLRLNYVLGTANIFLNRILVEDDDLVSYFTNVMVYTMMGGIVTCPLAGLVLDWQKRIYMSQPSMYRNEISAVLPLSIACGLAVLLSILVLFDEPALLYVIFITVTLYRSFLYCISAAFIADRFPIPYFVFLHGIAVACSGTIALLQYAIFAWSEAYDDAPLHTDICLLCLVLLSFVHPLHMWLRARRARSYIS